MTEFRQEYERMYKVMLLGRGINHLVYFILDIEFKIEYILLF